MKCLILFILIFCLLAHEDSLEFVVQIGRHGERAPEKSLFDDTWGDSIGHLTDVGRRNQRDFGAATAAYYPTINFSDRNTGNIYFRSTNKNRTIESAFSQMLGMHYGRGTILPENITVVELPYNGDQRVITNETNGCGQDALHKAGQPALINIVDLTLDTLLLPHVNACENFPNFEKLWLSSIRAAWILNMYGPLVSQVNQDLEVQGSRLISSLKDLFWFSDTVISDWGSGHDYIPGNYSNTSDIWINITSAYGIVQTGILYGDHNLTRIFAVPMMRQLEELLHQSYDGIKNNVEFVVLAAHDITIGLLLEVLGIMDFDCLWDNFWHHGIVDDPACHHPKFGSYVVFEVWKNKSNERYIIFKYDGVPLVVPGCGSVNCDYSTFMEIMQNSTSDFTMGDYNYYCREYEVLSSE